MAPIPVTVFAATPQGSVGIGGGTPQGNAGLGGGTPQGNAGLGGGGTPQGNAGLGGGTPQGNAGGANTATGQTLVNPLKVDSLMGLLDILLSAAIYIGGIVLVLALIWVGFLFVTARGNEEKIRSARTALVWTVIGGLILLGARGIEAVITSTVSNLSP